MLVYCSDPMFGFSLCFATMLFSKQSRASLQSGPKCLLGPDRGRGISCCYLEGCSQSRGETWSFLVYKMESSVLTCPHPQIRVEKCLLPEVLTAPLYPMGLCMASQVPTLFEFSGLLPWFLRHLSNAEKHENFEGPSVMNSLFSSVSTD